MDDILGSIIGVLMIVIFFAIYSLPSWVAVSRKHSNMAPIALVNLFFGWTIIGWCVALIWSFSDNISKKDMRNYEKV